ncbi:TPA: hypothetical protein ACHH4J_001698 [Streptococcus pneumoniae]
MDNKRLIHAVAGSGKTTKIIESIDPQKKKSYPYVYRDEPEYNQSKVD